MIRLSGVFPCHIPERHTFKNRLKGIIPLYCSFNQVMGSSLLAPRANPFLGKLKPDGGGNWLHFFVSCLLFQFPETD